MKIWEVITQRELKAVEDVVDQLWNKLGIDVKFGNHFVDRMNDPRNKEEITAKELATLFIKEYQKYGKSIADMNPETEAVLTDILSQLNVPIVMKPINNMNRQKTILAKTTMRKPNYFTKDIKYSV